MCVGSKLAELPLHAAKENQEEKYALGLSADNDIHRIRNTSSFVGYHVHRVVLVVLEIG